LWTEACGGSKNLTVANVEAVCCQNSPLLVIEPNPAFVSDTPRVSVPNFENRPRYVQPTIQRYAIQSRSGATQASQTLQQYILVLLNSEEGVDVLKLSCSLGYMASEGVEAARDTLGLDKVEDCVFHCIGRLREISKEMGSSLKSCIERSDFREIIHAISVTALEKFNSECQFSADGDSFFWRLANEKAAHINSMAVATFCVGIWPFMKETLLNELRFTAKLPEIKIMQFKSRWFIRIKTSGKEADILFDLSDFHQDDSSLTKGLSRDGGSGPLPFESDTPTHNTEGDLGKAFLLEFLGLECKNLRDGKQSKCIRSILEWNQKLDLRLCCFLPFVEYLENMIMLGCIPSSALPEVQKFVCVHENHNINSFIVNDRGLDSSGSSSPRLRRALDNLSRLLVEQGRPDRCSLADVYSASLAVGSSVDVVLDRLERSSWPAGKLGKSEKAAYSSEPS
jgi:hypothetical protein